MPRLKTKEIVIPTEEGFVIRVREYSFGGVWGTLEKGVEIKKQLEIALLKHPQVILCFEGVVGYSTKTLQSAFHSIVAEHGENVFNTKIKVRNLEMSDKAFAEEVLDALKGLPKDTQFSVEVDLPKVEISSEILDKVKVKKRRKK